MNEYIELGCEPGKPPTLRLSCTRKRETHLRAHLSHMVEAVL